MHSKKHNYKIGSGEGMFETNAYRKRPTYERVNSFLDEMGSDFSDHNVSVSYTHLTLPTKRIV